MHEVRLGATNHAGQDHYYMLGELDTVVGLIGERGNME